MVGLEPLQLRRRRFGLVSYFLILNSLSPIESENYFTKFTILYHHLALLCHLQNLIKRASSFSIHIYPYHARASISRCGGRLQHRANTIPVSAGLALWRELIIYMLPIEHDKWSPNDPIRLWYTPVVDSEGIKGWVEQIILQNNLSTPRQNYHCSALRLWKP